jgi:cytochrome oxidase Cu insertion factor (SCO1/SenC/PrrC family)
VALFFTHCEFACPILVNDLQRIEAALAAFTALQAQMANAQSYLNIHTTSFTGGEIRGILVPEPGSIGLAAIAGAGLLIRRRRPRAFNC